MKAEDKYALIASAFIPWVLLWVLHYAFPTMDAAMAFVAPMWLIVSPFSTLLFIWLTVKAARETNP